MLRKLILFGFLLLMLIPTLAQDAPSGELIIALPNDPTSLYGPRGADITAGNASSPLYDALVAINLAGELEPRLAESWEYNEAETEITFTLRQGVTFHNGEAFTAADVVATWEAGQNPENAYPFGEEPMLEVVDDFTVKVIVSQPDPLIMNTISTRGIIPDEHYAAAGMDGLEQNPIGTGAFMFVERTAGDRIVYEANPNYWREGVPNVARVIYRIIPDSSTRLAAIQTGEVHIVNRLSAEEAATLEGNDTLQLISYPTDRVYYLAFKNIGNGVGTPLEDVRVRQALNYAINRPGIVNVLFSGAANQISGFVVEGTLGYDESIEPYPYDVEQAQALLAEAGYADGFEISMGCPTDAYLNINEVCLAIQRDLGAVGIDVALEFRTSSSYWSEAQYGNVGPMYVDSWSSDLGEALNRLQGALRPGEFYAGWEDDTMTAFITELETTVDREARAEIYREVQRYMYDNPMFVYLYQPVAFEAVSDAVEGYQPGPNEGYVLDNITVSQ
jgi:peptide/nickel transport system substrate-binding protein